MRKSATYFLRAEGQGLVKIGRSRDVQRRIGELCVGSPCKLTLIGVLPGFDEESEEALHERFAHLRRRGEWFAEEGELAEFIKRLPSEEGYEEENERSTDKELSQLREETRELKEIEIQREAIKHLKEENQYLKQYVADISLLVHVCVSVLQAIEGVDCATERKPSIPFFSRGKRLSKSTVDSLHSNAEKSYKRTDIQAPAWLAVACERCQESAQSG